jgi:adenine-specific DNA-methyltransferase
MKASKQHSLGQYFTTNHELLEVVFQFIHNHPSNILEPSIGRGDIVQFISNRDCTVSFDMYEIDPTIPLLETIPKEDVIYADFLQATIDCKYKTIVGNPPYVKTRKGNLYIDFIRKCYDLLEYGGELIFIVPTDVFKLTGTAKLMIEMMKNGTFTDIYHPNNEKLFENASIDIIVFRYCKNPILEKCVAYNYRRMLIINNNGLITFQDVDSELHDKILLHDLFNVYVGLVSGKEEIYKNSTLGNIDVLNSEKTVDRYIYINEFPCDDTKINDYLLSHKTTLMARAIRKFDESNWYQWGAPRNIRIMETHAGEDCIYISTLTRKQNVAFLGKVQYFGGGLIMLKPKYSCDLNRIVDYLNSDAFKSNFTFSGRFKIGHRQLCYSFITNAV